MSDFEELAARLRAIEDRVEIAELIARYGPIVDAGAGELLTELWTPEGRYTVGDEFLLVGDKVAELTELPSHVSYLERGCAHVLTTPTVRVSGDHARAANHSVVLVREGAAWVADRVSANAWHFERTSAGWRVALRQNKLLDGSVAARDLLLTTGMA